MQLNNNDLTDGSKTSNEAENKTGRQLKFLLSLKPGETIEEFKARVIQAVRRTGMLKKRAH